MFNYNIKRLILIICEIVSTLILLIGLFFVDVPPVGYAFLFISVGLFILGQIYAFIFLRCPSCHKLLYPMFGKIFLDYCPYCGEKMYDDEYPKSKKNKSKKK